MAPEINWAQRRCCDKPGWRGSPWRRKRQRLGVIKCSQGLTT